MAHRRLYRHRRGICSYEVMVIVIVRVRAIVIAIVIVVVLVIARHFAKAEQAAIGHASRDPTRGSGGSLSHTEHARSSQRPSHRARLLLTRMVTSKSLNVKGEFPKIRSAILGVPTVRLIVSRGLCWGSLILGNYQVLLKLTGRLLSLDACVLSSCQGTSIW